MCSHSKHQEKQRQEGNDIKGHISGLTTLQLLCFFLITEVRAAQSGTCKEVTPHPTLPSKAKERHRDRT